MIDRIKQHETWLRWFVFAAIAVIYISFPTRSYFFDGIAFAQIIEETPGLRPSLLHPNHLIYNLIGAIFYRLILRLGFDIRAIAALQILNSLLSVVSAYVLFLILKSLLKSRYFCYALTLLFAFSSTWWKYSTDADAYIPSTLFLLISFSLILPGRKPVPLLVALTYSLALCFHQMAIVCFPVFVVGVFLQSRSHRRQQRIINALIFSVTAALITLAAYFQSFYLITGTFGLTNFARWTLSYAPDESFGFHAWNNLVFTLRGHARLFFGGRINALSGLVNPFVVMLLVLLIALTITLIFKVIRHFRKPKLQSVLGWQEDSRLRTVGILCVLWIGLYLIFLFLLLPHHTFYRLLYLPAIIILLGLSLDSYNTLARISRKYRLALFVAVVCLTNFLTLIYPYSHEEKYPPLVLALEMNQVWPRGTVIYYGQPNSDNSLVRYFNPGMSWELLDSKTPEMLVDEVGRIRSRGGAAWLETSAINQLASSPEGTEWLKQHTGNARTLVTKAHDIRFVQIISGDK